MWRSSRMSRGSWGEAWRQSNASCPLPTASVAYPPLSRNHWRTSRSSGHGRQRAPGKPAVTAPGLRAGSDCSRVTRYRLA
jgi:hypothetical protein